jgi:hypothetical protein
MYNDLDEISFAEWLVELNNRAISSGYHAPDSFAAITGIIDWHPYYDEGVTPTEALSEAEKDANKYGAEYLMA